MTTQSIDLELVDVPMSSSDRVLAIFCHLAPLLSAGILLPLIVYFVSRKEKSPVFPHARETLNFHISLTIAFLIGAVLTFVAIGAVVLLVLFGMTIFCAIKGAMQASKGELYHYPMTWRVVK